MALSVWEVFLARFRDGDGADDEAGEDDDASGKDNESRFVPSPLDLSVRFAHGGSDSQRVRELADVSERAQELEENRRQE